MMDKKVSKLTSMYLWLILVAVVMTVPFVYMLVMSFMSYPETIAVPPVFWPQKFLTENFARVFETVPFILFYRNSIFITVMRVIGLTFTCSLSGYVFAKYDFPGKNTIFIIILAIMMIPGQMFLLPQYLNMIRFGWLDEYKAVIIPNLFSAYGIFLFRQFFQTMPNSLIEAGIVEGVGHFRAYISIALPSIKAGMVFFLMQSTLGSWNDYLWPLITLSSPEKQPLPIFLSLMQGQFVSDVPAMMAAATMSAFPMLVLYSFAQKKFENLEFSSGIK